MNSRSLILVILVLCALMLQPPASASDRFSLAGVMSFDRVVDAALVNERLYVLGPGSLTIYDASLPDSEFRKLESIAVGKEFVELEASTELLILGSRLGAIDIYELNDAGITPVSHFQSPDSALGVSLFQDRLCIAHGTSGVSVYDLADHLHPLLKSRLLEPDYAGDVKVTSALLYVLDRLNGVQVYDLGPIQPRYLAEIPSERPVLELAADRDGLAICDGSSVVTYWRCSVLEGAALDHSHDFEFPVTRLTADPRQPYRVLAGSDRGDLALYDSGAKIILAQIRLSAPVERLLVAEGVSAFPYAAILETGGLVAFEGSHPFEDRKELQSGDRPSSLAAVKDGAVISRARGLELLQLRGSDVVTYPLIPAVPIYTVLQVSDETIVGANAAKGRIQLYQRNSGRIALSDELDNLLNLVDMRVSRRLSGSVGLYVFDPTYVMEIELFPDGTVAPDYGYDWPVEISVGAVSGTLLMGASEAGHLVIYQKGNFQGRFLLEAQIAPRPRDLEIMDDSLLAVASPEGLDIYRVDRLNSELDYLTSVSGVYSPFDLEYDEASKFLFVADGYAGLKYLDVTNPAIPSPVLTVESTEGTTIIKHFNDTFYCLSSDWLKVLTREKLPGSIPTIRGDIASVEAFPNPFNAGTEITLRFATDVPLPLVVNLTLLNILGQRVAETDLPVSKSEIRIGLTDLFGGSADRASGIYFLRAKANGQPLTRKLVLLK